MFFLSPGLIIPEWTPLSQITAIRSSIPFTPLGICRKIVENTFTFSEVSFLHWTTFFGSAEHFHFLKYHILSAKPLWSRWYQGLSVLRWTCSCLYQCTEHENNCLSLWFWFFEKKKQIFDQMSFPTWRLPLERSSMRYLGVSWSSLNIPWCDSSKLSNQRTSNPLLKPSKVRHSFKNLRGGDKTWAAASRQQRL